MPPRTAALPFDAVSPIPPDVDPVATGPDPGVLERIFLPGIVLAAWQRGLEPALAEALAGWRPAGERVLLHRFAVPASGTVAPAAIAGALEPLADRALRAAVADSVAGLAELYAVLADATEIGLRLAVTRGRPCPRFHVDRVGLRLICTLQGPGTEWLAPADVDRRRLGGGAGDLPDESSGLLRPGTTVRRLQAGDVGLFKGDAWPGNAGRGIVHRSPPTDGGWRLLVSLDAL